MPQIDPKTFSPFALELRAPDHLHGSINHDGEWDWEIVESRDGSSKTYATLWRDPYAVRASSIPGRVDVLTTKTTPCPFCRKGHIHGIGDGHRVPHCTDRRKKEAVTLDDGTVVYHKDGYIVRTRLI